MKMNKKKSGLIYSKYTWVNILLLLILIEIPVFYIYSTLYDNAHISTTGSIASSVDSINVTLYWNANMTDLAQNATWGEIEGGGNNTITIYVVSDSNINMTIRLFTGRYIPAEIEQYLIVSWDREGAVLAPLEVTEAKITLSVTPDAPYDSNFSFDILIEGSG